MKKLFLLLAAGSMAVAASAQVSNSLSFTPPDRRVLPAGALKPMSDAQVRQVRDLSPAVGRRHSAPASKSTSSSCCGPYSAWYDMWNQNTSVSGGSLVAPAVGYYFALYPDSTILDDYGTGAHTNVFWHGEGMLFDPTDSGYYLAPYGNAINFGVQDDVTGGTDLMQLTGQAYTIDSISIPISYHRHNPLATVVDSVVIEIAVTRYPGTVSGAIDSGAYTLQYSTPSASFYPISFDEKPRFGTLRYSPGGSWDPSPYNLPIYVNDCYFDSVFTQKERYTIPLTGAAGDTDANGFVYLTKSNQSISMVLSPAINIYSSRVHAVAYVSFKSGATYALNTPASSANLIHMFAGEPNGATTWFRQNSSNLTVSPTYPGSYQCAVYSTNQERYLHNGPIDTGFSAASVGPHDILVPSVAFLDAGTSVSEVGWHIKWSGVPVDALGVNNVTNTISTVSAYPNPANDELNVPFTLAQNANVTVSLINMVGQTIATKSMGNVSTGTAVFSTAGLPDGVYIYSIQANGERTTGRVAIQH